MLPYNLEADEPGVGPARIAGGRRATVETFHEKQSSTANASSQVGGPRAWLAPSHFICRRHSPEFKKPVASSKVA